jgi:hypothetical protein
MSIKIETVNATDAITEIQTVITQTEALGFELVAIAKGIVNGQPAKVVTLRRRKPGDRPAKLTLVKQETGARKLISYSAVFIEGKETMIVAYRG